MGNIRTKEAGDALAGGDEGHSLAFHWLGSETDEGQSVAEALLGTRLI